MNKAAANTNREALIESLRGPLANVLCNAINFPDGAQPHILGADMGPLMDATAEAVVDAVVMPLVQERDELQAENERLRERWRQLMRDHEAAVREREAAEAENERLRILWDASGKNDLIERAEAAEAAHKALIEAVRGLTRWHPLVSATDLRATLAKHGAGR